MPEVSGPAASPASRDEIALLERCALRGWPALASRDVMGWVLRSAHGYTKRANSANALVPAGDFAAVRREAEAYYTGLGQPVIFRLSPLAPPEADAELGEAGYALVEPSLVMVAGFAHADHNPSVTIVARADEAWFRGFAEATGEASDTIARHAALHAAIAPPHAVAAVVRDGRPVAFGLAVSEAGRVGLFDIAVAPAHRGQGLGAVISRALLAWGCGKGAESAYLQVTAANLPALRTYARLGFAEAYGYHYRVRQASSQLA